MRIAASEVSYLTSHRSASATAATDETLSRPRTSTPNSVTSSTPVIQTAAVDTVQLSGLAGSYAACDREDLEGLDPKQRTAVLAIEALLGRRVKLLRIRPQTGGSTGASNSPAAAGTAELRRRTEIHYEMERTSFQAQGMVETADGRSIQFTAQFTMQREFRSETTTISSASTTDPLVVNYGGAPVRLTDAKVAFDLNSDGSQESISFVAGGSGFLMLDSNGDGQATNGRELFGPQTGDGFAELASYDADRNGWIDENDPVFDQLRIWTLDGLSTLLEKGIGAISTNSAETPFALKDAINVLQGSVRSSGIYLAENGAAGTVQQVDLAVG